MSLATLTTLINNKIRNKTPKVIKTEHADVEQAIVDEFFNLGVLDNQLTSNLIEFNPFSRPESAVLGYSISLKKTGNVIFIYGLITNIQNVSQSFVFEPFARIKDAVNRPANNTNIAMVKTSNTQNHQYLNINTLGEIRLQGLMSPLESVSINGYFIINP